jgi:hypothetical protein
MRAAALVQPAIEKIDSTRRKSTIGVERSEFTFLRPFRRWVYIYIHPCFRPGARLDLKGFVG